MQDGQPAEAGTQQRKGVENGRLKGELLLLNPVAPPREPLPEPLPGASGTWSARLARLGDQRPEQRVGVQLSAAPSAVAASGVISPASSRRAA